MPSAYATNKAQAFAAAPIKIFYERSVADSIVNRNYEGEIKGKGTIVNVLTFSKVTWQSYTGADMSPTALQEVKGVLTTDQQKSYYFKVKDIDTLTSWIKNPQGTVIEQLGNQLKEDVDNYVLSFWGDVAAGNRVGTDYTTGTVAIDVSGNVTGTGTTFTSSMVGKGFKAAGHSIWYRVKTYSSATAIVIENDSDDETSAYGGGVISAGATYTIEAATTVTLLATNIDAQIVALRTKLSQAKIAQAGRWLVVPSSVYGLMLQANIFTPYTPQAYEDVVQKGIVGMARGFKVYESQQVAGDSVNGYHILAGVNDWMTMAEALVEAEEEPFIAGNFGTGYKGLFVWGVKVLDERRKCAAELFAK